MAAKGDGKIRILYFGQAAQIIRSLDLIRVSKYVLNAYYTLTDVLGTGNIAKDDWKPQIYGSPVRGIR